MLTLLFTLILTASAIPTPTPAATATGLSDPNPSRVTTAPASTITPDPALICSPGSTLIHTTDCTMGTPTSYCFKPEPPIKCEAGYFPSVWHPGHCMELSTCFPLTANWITTECVNGAVPWSTSTLFDGTLADGAPTAIIDVSCSCRPDQWYSMAGNDMYCMPSSSCPSGMITSVSTNEYCVTASCEGSATTTARYRCENPSARPVYPNKVGAVATGCA